MRGRGWELVLTAVLTLMLMLSPLVIFRSSERANERGRREFNVDVDIDVDNVAVNVDVDVDVFLPSPPPPPPLFLFFSFLPRALHVFFLGGFGLLSSQTAGAAPSPSKKFGGKKQKSLARRATSSSNT